jgi:hypothetical protein
MIVLRLFVTYVSMFIIQLMLVIFYLLPNLLQSYMVMPMKLYIF